MKKLMIYIAILSILAASQAQAVVEDSGNAPGDDYAAGDSWSSPASPSMPTYLPSPCYGDSGRLKVGISQSGPESERDKAYITQGSTLGFMVSVENEGDTEVEADLSINPLPETRKGGISIRGPGHGLRFEDLCQRRG
ncbi:MAG: hypothetical protein LUQ15_03620 [Methanothrix sp.]|nr:hypothetical protein [Methanothrix sp.]OYV09210.1 MAG: hypothetical protein CG437_1293 [Methanosaeta sp. NSP1]